MTDSERTVDPQRVFLTGEPGCGKTTVLSRATEMLVLRGVKVGGMMSSDFRKGGTRAGFSIENIMTHEKGVLASVDGGKGPRVGRYTVNIHDLEEVGAAAITRATEDADVILIDELGPMELYSSRFIESVKAALDSRKHILGTLHKRASHPLILQVKSNPRSVIINVTNKDREELPVRIVKRIIGVI